MHDMANNDDKKFDLLKEKMFNLQDEIEIEQQANEILTEKKYKEMSLLEVSF